MFNWLFGTKQTQIPVPKRRIGFNVVPYVTPEFLQNRSATQFANVVQSLDSLIIAADDLKVKKIDVDVSNVMIEKVLHEYKNVKKFTVDVAESKIKNFVKLTISW